MPMTLTDIDWASADYAETVARIRHMVKRAEDDGAPAPGPSMSDNLKNIWSSVGGDKLPVAAQWALLTGAGGGLLGAGRSLFNKRRRGIGHTIRDALTGSMFGALAGAGGSLAATNLASKPPTTTTPTGMRNGRKTTPDQTARDRSLTAAHEARHILNDAGLLALETARQSRLDSKEPTADADFRAEVDAIYRDQRYRHDQRRIAPDAAFPRRSQSWPGSDYAWASPTHAMNELDYAGLKYLSPVGRYGWLTGEPGLVTPGQRASAFGGTLGGMAAGNLLRNTASYANLWRPEQGSYRDFLRNRSFGSAAMAEAGRSLGDPKIVENMARLATEGKPLPRSGGGWFSRGNYAIPLDVNGTNTRTVTPSAMSNAWRNAYKTEFPKHRAPSMLRVRRWPTLLGGLAGGYLNELLNGAYTSGRPQPETFIRGDVNETK